MNPKAYLDYLDKEMTIMGILSAFSVAAAAGVLVTVLTKDGTGPAIWRSCPIFVLGGSVLSVIAASFFYKERSTLAWNYGKISFIESNSNDTHQLKNAIEEAHAWDMWWSYSVAFTALTTGFAQYLLAALLFILPTRYSWSAHALHVIKLSSFALTVVACLCTCGLQSYVLTKYKNEDEPWKAWKKGIQARDKA